MKNEIICINFNNEKLKFARVKCLPKKKEVTDIVIKDIKGFGDSDVSKVIRSLFKEAGGKKASVICILSSHSLLTKNIEIPSRDPKEIQEIVTLQSGRYTPYSREEIIVDHINIGTYRQNYTKTLLVIVPREVIKKQLDIFNGAGLEVEKISIIPEAISRICPHILSVKNEEGVAGVIHPSDDSTDFIVVFKNKLIFMRNFPIGARHFLAEPEGCKERFVGEIKKSLESYQSEDIEKTPNRIILTGAMEGVGDIKTFLDKALCIPITVVPYLERLSIRKDALNSISSLKQISFLDVISPLFVSDELNINLMPEEMKLNKRLEARGKEIIKMGILIMAIFVLICGILIGNIHLKQTYLGKLTSKYRSVVQEAQGLEKSFSRLQSIRGYLVNRGYSLEILNELHRLLLPNIYLNNIKFGEEELSIKGSSESMSTVFTLVSKMEESKYFQNVKTKYTTKRKEEDKDVTDFQINCTFERTR